MKNRAKDAAVWLGLCLLIGTGLLAYLFLKEAVHRLLFLPLVAWIERSNSWTVIIFVGCASVISTGFLMRIIWLLLQPRRPPRDP